MEFMKQYNGMSNKDGYNWQGPKDWFGEEYLAVYAHCNLDDANKLLNLFDAKLFLNSEDPILDGTCGRARHTLQVLNRCVSWLNNEN